MAWETRNGKGRYYTRSVWDDGRVIREYVGTGAKGKKAAHQDALRRAELARMRLQAQKWEAEEKARQEAVEGPLAGLEGVVKMLMAVAMEREGYHKPGRWQWRKKRCILSQ